MTAPIAPQDEIGRVKGWCPGALRPMASGDGLIVRVRPRGGRLDRAQALGIAALAARFGNGLVDISRRANLQLRGVGEAGLPELVAALDGLGLLDADAEAERIRNIVASPLAGLDASAAIDGAGVVAALEAVLAGTPGLGRLPAKFGFLVDEGGALWLGDVAADVRLVGRITPAGPRVVLAVGGDAAAARTLGTVAPEDAATAAIATARAFIDLTAWMPSPPRRMAALLVAEAGLVERLCARVAEAVPLDASAPADDDQAAPPGDRADLGFRPDYVGVAAPFGRMAAGDLAALAALSPGGVRPTPWRGLILAGAGTEALAEAEARGLVTAASDPRRGVDACPGAPDCTSAEVETRAAAMLLAPLAAGRTLHVSGCAKGCARSAPARYTLVGRAGAYDLVEDGRADAAPARTGLSLDEAAALLGAGAATGTTRP